MTNIVTSWKLCRTSYPAYNRRSWKHQPCQLALIFPLQSQDVPSGPSPPDLSGQQLSFIPEIAVDKAPEGRNFGDCLTQPRSSYFPGETVIAEFVAGNPSNDHRQEGTFLTVERIEEGVPRVIHTDADFETRCAIWPAACKL